MCVVLQYSISSVQSQDVLYKYLTYDLMRSTNKWETQFNMKIKEQVSVITIFLMKKYLLKLLGVR